MIVAGALVTALGLSGVGSAGQASAPAALATGTSSGPPIAAYSLVVANTQSTSGLIARAVLPGGLGCPRLDATVIGAKGQKRVSRPMQVRSTGQTTLNAFTPLRVCEARMPRGAVAASIAGQRIPASKPSDIDSIAVLGDSGCRLNATAVQACNDPTQWPLARISRRIAADRPDLVIYLGDFYYREGACPPTANSLCGGSPAPLNGAPFTDSAWGWVADVLVPMSPLLQSVPVVVVRGNHELCSRGGNGYFLLFDPAFGTAATCAPSADGVAPVVYSPTTAIDLSIEGNRTLRLVNVDSANGNDTAIDDTIPIYQRPLFQKAQRLAHRADEAWLMTHRPITALVSSEYLPVPPGEATTWTSVTQAYSSYGLLGDYDLMLSSHLHIAQAVQIPGMPGQIVLGNGGTMLDPTTGYAIPAFGPLSNASGETLVPAPPLPPYPAIPTATSLHTWVEFGYVMATPASSGWTFDMRDVGGQSFATCKVDAGEVACP